MVPARRVPFGHASTGPVEVAPLQGVKEEPVKEEPVDAKPEPANPLPIEAIQQRVNRGTEGQLLRSSGQIPDEPCEDWSRSPPNSSQTELSPIELGGQQEPLGADYASITFDQKSPHGHQDDCYMGDAAAPLTVPIQEGLSENSHLSLAEKRIIQANEQLVQEVRTFQQEYTKSCRETASFLRSIAEALSGVHNSLSEIRDLYLRQQVVPKQ
ncbi:uncharacterized protein LOC125432448 [Sphaerodactylus townsendi]|uniref:uncharacterized protein LOC125432448 n=1 Tax=Sphaerodactylus townsendi TaxID=933632 RepID=UPI002025D6FA|nr:uncharacterized protein LOC125432448 [Sphaerodactylus townsendi]